MRTYDGHGNETVFKRGQVSGLPCCKESSSGVCEQHIDEYMRSRGYWYEGGRKYRLARERAAERLNRDMASPTL